LSKKLCIIANIPLLIWFFLDQFGFAIGNYVFVEAAWKDIDGIWYLIFIGLLVLFCVKDKYGKYPLTIFLFLWLVTQFLSHWYGVIFGATVEQIAKYNRFYANTWHIIPISDSKIIPDFYHIVLHIFVLSALFCLILYVIKRKGAR
jgi:hypothetical protein